MPACTNCASQVAENSRFCPNCGTFLASQGSEQQQYHVDPGQSTSHTGPLPGYGPADQPGYGPADQPGYGPPAYGPADRPGYGPHDPASAPPYGPAPHDPASAPPYGPTSGAPYDQGPSYDQAPPYGPASGPPYGPTSGPPYGPEQTASPAEPRKLPIIPLVVALVVVVLAITTVIIFKVMSGGPSSQNASATSGARTPTPTRAAPTPTTRRAEPGAPLPSASASGAATDVESCLVGSWKETKGERQPHVTPNDKPLGSGMTVTVTEDGKMTWDYGNGILYKTKDGTNRRTFRGKIVYQATAKDGALTLAGIQEETNATEETGYRTAEGKPSPVRPRTENLRYTCEAGKLTMFNNTFNSELAKTP